MSAVLAAARAAIARRRLQTVIVAVVVLLSAATGVLALGLLAESHGPFDKAFGEAQGAHMVATIAADVPAQQVADTADATGVEAAAGPFDQVSAVLKIGERVNMGEAHIVGRAEQNGAVDRLALDQGAWLTGPGQIVVSRRFTGPGVKIGTELTVGTVQLKVVGIASSVTGTADVWVWPTQSDVLQGEGLSRQMLYRFSAHATDAELRAAYATATAALPAQSKLDSTTYLTVRMTINRSISAFVPFVVAFAVLGIILSVLITVNIVNGAVVSGFRTIGVLKTLGYTPRQVVAVYILQVLGPALVGCLVGVPVGVLLAMPLLADTDRAYDLPSQRVSVPLWVIVTVLVAAPLLVAISAVGPATRAGRLAAYQAISVGRAPRTGRGFRARRALTASRLPRPVALGLGLPLARPSRAAGTVVALLLGSVTLVFAVGLAASLDRIHTAFSRIDAVQVTVEFGLAGPGVGPKPQGPALLDAPDQDEVRAKITAASGTQHVALLRSGSVHAAGITQEISFYGYADQAGWTGHQMITGRWYATPDEVVASSYFLRQTGHHVGDRLTLSDGKAVAIVGEFLDGDSDLTLVGDASVVPDGHPGFEIGLTAGTDPGQYAQALQEQFPQGVHVEDQTADSDQETFLILYTLISTLTLLLCGVAALGVVNTVVLTTRERIHEIGVLKALGMTPRQTRTMIVTSMVGLGLLAGVVAVPLGVALQHQILPVMGNAAGTGMPHSIVEVYSAVELVLLGLAGVVIAVLGALAPAGWAARTRVATALRAE